MLSGSTFLEDERKWAKYERGLVENTAVTSLEQAATTRGSDISGSGARYRRPDRLGGRRFHRVDGTDWNATVSGWRCSVAAPAVSGRRLTRRWLLAVSLFSCLLYTSDAADEEDSVDLGGRRI